MKQPELFIVTRDVKETGDAHDDAFLNVRKFLSDGCGCKHQCDKRFNFETVINHLLDIRALAKEEKERFVLVERRKQQKRARCSLTSQHVREHGLTPRVHGNCGRKPKHAICYDDKLPPSRKYGERVSRTSKIAGPRDDVCAKCETLRRGVMDAVTEEEKLTATDSLRNHILLAQK
ncbi:hypothetical protein DPMN_075300, partial [Dreissena polymorpha]